MLNWIAMSRWGIIHSKHSLVIHLLQLLEGESLAGIYEVWISLYYTIQLSL